MLKERRQASASGLRLALLQGQDLTPRLIADFYLAHGLEQIDTALAGAHKRSRGFADDPVFHAHRFFDPRLQALAEQALAGADPASAPTPAAPPTPP